LGNATVKVVPLSISLVAISSPPKLSKISTQVCNPSPVPVGSPVICSLPFVGLDVYKGSKILDKFSGAIPQPVSLKFI